MRDASIVIGLGGIGSEICAEVEALIPKSAPDRDRVRFAAVDTDINSLLDLKRKGFRGTTIQISDNISVGACVENEKPEIEGWYPDNPMFEKKPMTEGAGQMRALSRLALHTAVKEGRLAPLYRMVDELREVSKDPSVQAVRFYIVSSLSGGTGSGIFLPMGMYLERYVKRLFGDYDSICKGFFILPSAMRDLTETFLEKRSLDSNSYAAIKELSAFLAQGDGEENGESRIFMELAREGETETSPYYSAGYEYCYVFGKVNRRKLLKASFGEVKNAVANAVYMQVCSPIRGVNNSREDNMPKFLAEQAQRQMGRRLKRFGAIGCGELVYPYEMLKSYFAMQWACDIMSNEWQKYDRRYFELERENRENRKRGKRAGEVSRSETYVNAVRLAERGDIFSEEIRDSCTLEDGTGAWDSYLRELSKEIERTIGRIQKEKEQEDVKGPVSLKRIMEKMESEHYTPKEKSGEAEKAREEFIKTREFMERYVPDNSRFVTKRLFLYHPGIEPQPYEMAYWLARGGVFMHPNAVRYFLYQLLEAVTRNRKEAVKRKEQEDSLVHVVDLYNDEKVRRKLRGRQIVEFIEKIKKAQEALYRSAGMELEILCLDYLYEYAGRLVKSYEEFYDNYGELLQRFADESDDITAELDDQSGISSFYVCSDKECREEMLRRLKEKREYVRASSALSAFIFERLQEPLKGERMKAVFPDIRRHWVESVEQEFGDWLDMNILQAMRTEEECRTGRQLSAEEMKRRIRESRELLETPMVRYISRDETKEISFCCYNSELEEQRGFFKDVMRWLSEAQGIADPYYCSRYQMIFYCSTVGIEAHDILEFYHGRAGSMVEKGEAFLHYEETVQSVLLDRNDNPALAPHIDRKWYSFLYLPDSHKGYQHRKETMTAGMFLYAWLSGRMARSEKGFHYTNSQADDKSFEKLLLCHQYLYKRPLLLQDLLSQFEAELKADVKRCHSMQECRLFRDMDERNVYDLIVEYASQLTKREFIPEKARLLLLGVEWLVKVCVYYFKGSGHEGDVAIKMQELSEKKREFTAPDKDTAKEMEQILDDFYADKER